VRTGNYKGVLLSALVIASLIAPLLLISAEAARGQDIGWIRQFGTSDYDYAWGVAVDPSSNVYVAGSTGGTLPGQTSAGLRDAFVRKYDGSGNEIWTRQFGTSGGDGAGGITIDGSGNIYVVGNTEGAFPGQLSSGGYDAFVRKYDGSGNEIWTRQFGTSGDEGVQDIAIDGSSNVYVAGYTWGVFPGQVNLGGPDAFVRKYDGSGNELWTRQFGTSGGDSANDITIDGSGNVYVAGETYGTLPGQTSAGIYDGFVRKYDGSGNEIWTRQFGTSQTDYARGIAVDSSDNVYVVDSTGGTLPGQTSSGGNDAFVRKYDGSGNEIWTRQFGTSDSDGATGVAVDPSNNVYVACVTTGTLPGQTSSGGNDAFVRKYDGSENEIWTRQFGTSDYDSTSGVAVDPSNNVYVAGYTYGTLPGQLSSGGTDAFLVKFVQPAPAPVGGIAFPADKLALLAPWITLAVVIAIVSVSVAVYWRKR